MKFSIRHLPISQKFIPYFEYQVHNSYEANIYLENIIYKRRQ